MFRKRSGGTPDLIYELVWLGLVALAAWGWGAVLGWLPMPHWLTSMVSAALAYVTCVLILAAVLYFHYRY
jgi:hypothetical protein